MSAGHDRGFLSIPNGWFAVAWSKDLAVGEVQRIRYFDTELVLFRTRTGQVNVLDAYCPHLGAHLAEGGRVVGEAIQCPFHHWQYRRQRVGACISRTRSSIPAESVRPRLGRSSSATT